MTIWTHKHRTGEVVGAKDKYIQISTLFYSGEVENWFVGDSGWTISVEAI